MMKHRYLPLLILPLLLTPQLFGQAPPKAAPKAAPPATTPKATPKEVEATPPAYKPPETIEEVLEVLAKSIREKNDPMRMRMWFRVREQGAEAVPALLKAFDQYPEMEIKEYMVKCLSWSKSEKAYQKVLSLMKSDNVVLRRRATYEINNFDDPRAVPPLIEALKDPDERARVNATIALGVLDDKRAIAPLKRTYQSDSSKLVREFAKKQLELYEINYPEAHVK